MNEIWTGCEDRIKWDNCVQKYPALTGDVNGNGKTDIVFLFRRKGPKKKLLTVRTLFSNGNGTWSGQEYRSDWGADLLRSQNKILTGDVNGNGKTDLIFPFQDWRDDKGLTVRTLLGKETAFSIPSGGELIYACVPKKRLIFIKLCRT